MNKKDIIQCKNDIIQAIYCMVKKMIKNVKRRERLRYEYLYKIIYILYIHIWIGYVFVKLQK